MNTFQWDDMDYWTSGEWQVVQEYLDLLKEKKVMFNPARHLLFAALDACPYDQVKVVILGQDPYPDHSLATGIAFSVPSSIKDLPATLECLFDEYQEDLKYPRPTSGDLRPWCKQGVLLWNVIPSCQAGKSLSHRWPEWELLTAEILRRLSEKNVVFVALGSVARSYLKHVSCDPGSILEFSHPSPRGSLRSKIPFKGCRLFSTINARLRDQGLSVVDWKLR